RQAKPLAQVEHGNHPTTKIRHALDEGGAVRDPRDWLHPDNLLDAPNLNPVRLARQLEHNDLLVPDRQSRPLHSQSSSIGLGMPQVRATVLTVAVSWDMPFERRM